MQNEHEASSRRIFANVSQHSESDDRRARVSPEAVLEKRLYANSAEALDASCARLMSVILRLVLGRNTELR